VWYALQALLLLLLLLFIVCPHSDVVVWCTLHLAGEPPLEQSELSANAIYLRGGVDMDLRTFFKSLKVSLVLRLLPS
jgi:hypothetical protein